MENNGPGKLSELIGDNFIPPSSTPPLNPDPAQSASLPASAPLPSAPLNQARSWAMWCHLSALAGLVVPLGNILGPLIVWQMKRNEFPSVDAHGKAALNFQLSALIYLFGGSIAMVKSPIRMSDTPVTYRHAPPVKGSSTEAVLRDVLGKTEEEVAALNAKGVV